jgi:hypothetical protein
VDILLFLPAYSRVEVKTLRCLGEQLRGHGQIALGARDIDMSKVRREQWQEDLNVCTLAVPSDEPVDSEGMSEVVKARLPACARRATYAGLVTETDEDPL